MHIVTSLACAHSSQGWFVCISPSHPDAPGGQEGWLAPASAKPDSAFQEVPELSNCNMREVMYR